MASRRTTKRRGKAKAEPATGRPTKLTPAVARIICAAVRMGKPLHIAAAEAGVVYDTLRDWQRQGENPGCKDRALIAFSVDLARARGVAEWDLLEESKRLAQPTDRSSNPGKPEIMLSILKVMNPKAYSDKHALELSGPEGGPVQMVGADAKSAVLNAIWGAPTDDPSPDPETADTEPPPKP